jgi:hypothetical protein
VRRTRRAGQFVTAQPARKAQLDGVEVGTEVLVGPNADKALPLDIPLFVSDMSFGARSEEEYCTDDLTTFDREMAQLTGIADGGVRLS